MSLKSKRKKRALKRKNSKEKIAVTDINPGPENRRIFESARDHLNEASIKNSESFDKAILSLSSAGLALSLTFTKFVVPIGEATNLILLHISWLCFGCSIISTVSAFLTSFSAIAVEREHIHKYYMMCDDDYANKTNVWDRITYFINRVSAVFFIVGVFSAVSYVWLNTQQDINMSDELEGKGYIPTKNEPANNQGGQTQKPDNSSNSQGDANK